MQRYYCKNCKHIFSNKTNSKAVNSEKIFTEYVFHRQTQIQLVQKYKVTPKTIRKYLKQAPRFASKKPPNTNQDVVIAIDSTYFGRVFCAMVFRDVHSKQNLYWKFIPYETIAEYKAGIHWLNCNGFKVKAIVCDGRKGIFQAFQGIPIQMCQFHQVAIAIRYLTRRPKLVASIELLAIVRKLKSTDSNSFKGMLTKWELLWRDFIKERSINYETGKWYYTHKRLRSAYFSLIHNMDHLFVYENFPGLNIPNTTNSLEGIFTDIKTHVRVHKGIGLENKKKLLNEIFKKEKIAT